MLNSPKNNKIFAWALWKNNFKHMILPKCNHCGDTSVSLLPLCTPARRRDLQAIPANPFRLYAIWYCLFSFKIVFGEELGRFIKSPRSKIGWWFGNVPCNSWFFILRPILASSSVGGYSAVVGRVFYDSFFWKKGTKCATMDEWRLPSKYGHLKPPLWFRSCL